MSNKNFKFTIYWYWRIGRLTLQLWTFMRLPYHWMRFIRRSDGGWVFTMWDFTMIWASEEETT